MTERAVARACNSDVRCPGRSARDILLADGDGTPPVLLEESVVPLDEQPIAYSRYYDEAFARREQEAVWEKVWQ